MSSVTFTNTRIVYIKNGVNQMDMGVVSSYNESGPPKLSYSNYTQNTGWHVIPNQQWWDYLTWKNWHHLITNYEYICPAHVEVTIQNLIPLTDDLSIAQDTTFMSFNNTIYALTYQDNIYETHQQQFNDPKLYYREGLNLTTPGSTAGTKDYLPVYIHRLPYISSGGLLRSAWDPLVKADHLGELRPGKNAVKFSWSRNAQDNDKWYFLGSWFSTDRSYDVSDKVVFDNFSDTMQATQLVTPGELYKQYPDNAALGPKRSSEYLYYWKYPIPNMFIKMVPIFNTKNALLKHEGSCNNNEDYSRCKRLW